MFLLEQTKNSVFFSTQRKLFCVVLQDFGLPNDCCSFCLLFTNSHARKISSAVSLDLMSLFVQWMNYYIMHSLIPCRIFIVRLGKRGKTVFAKVEFLDVCSGESSRTGQSESDFVDNAQHYLFFFFHSEKMIAPDITRKPTNKEVKEGQRARYDVTVTGMPKPEMTW